MLRVFGVGFRVKGFMVLIFMEHGDLRVERLLVLRFEDLQVLVRLGLPVSGVCPKTRLSFECPRP